MLRRADFPIHFRNRAVGADQVADSRGVALLRVCGGSIGDTNRPILIAQEVERKVEFVFEGLIFRWSVTANANDHGVFCVEILDSITEPLSFDSSAGCIGLRVPPQ